MSKEILVSFINIDNNKEIESFSGINIPPYNIGQSIFIEVDKKNNDED